jgi:hypothetical protein
LPEGETVTLWRAGPGISPSGGTPTTQLKLLTAGSVTMYVVGMPTSQNPVSDIVITA